MTGPPRVLTDADLQAISHAISELLAAERPRIIVAVVERMLAEQRALSLKRKDLEANGDLAVRLYVAHKGDARTVGELLAHGKRAREVNKIIDRITGGATGRARAIRFGRFLERVEGAITRTGHVIIKAGYAHNAAQWMVRDWLVRDDSGEVEAPNIPRATGEPAQVTGKIGRR